MATHSRLKRFLVASLAFVGGAIALRLAVECYVRFVPRSGVLVTISKETTYITEPLRPDGYPDYTAALNNRASKGVTPENNAVVPFFRAMGPGMLKQEFRNQAGAFPGVTVGPGMDHEEYLREYCKALGIPPLPEKGEYFVAIVEYAETLKPTKPGNRPDDENWNEIKQLFSAMKRPWRAEEFPLIAKWLAANQRPLDLLVEASTRPRWFRPLISEGGIRDSTMTAAMNTLREVNRAQNARAMQRLKDGKFDQAWADLLAAHRLARLASQGPTLIDGLVATTMDNIACAADQVLLQHANLTAAQAAKMQADLAALPPMTKMIDTLDVGERFFHLDSVMMLARGEEVPRQEMENRDTSDAGIDWDLVLRTGNEMYERVVEAERLPARAERRIAAQNIDTETAKQMMAAEGWKHRVLWALTGSRRGESEAIGLLAAGLRLEGADAVMNAEDRGNMTFDITKLAFALAEYRARQGSYPAKLADLVPKYVAAIPKDIFSGGPLHYSRQGDGYLLYSVGPNGKDDGGRNQSDNPDDEKLADCDDIAVRIPAKAK
jgi:hypothetical protein